APPNPPAAPETPPRLFIALAETAPNRDGLAELLDGLAQRVRRFSVAQLFAFADRAFGRDAPPVFILRLSHLGRGYKVPGGRRELERGPQFNRVIARRFGDHRNVLRAVRALRTID